jgi:hypothetical protein
MDPPSRAKLDKALYGRRHIAEPRRILEMLFSISVPVAALMSCSRQDASDRRERPTVSI